MKRTLVSLALILSLFLSILSSLHEIPASSQPFNWRDEFDYKSLDEMKNAGWALATEPPFSDMLSVRDGKLTVDSSCDLGGPVIWYPYPSIAQFPPGLYSWRVEVLAMWTGQKFANILMSAQDADPTGLKFNTYGWGGDGRNLDGGSQFVFTSHGTGGEFSKTIPGYAPQQNVWVRLAMEKTGSNIRLYWNDELEHSYDVPDSSSTYLFTVGLNAYPFPQCNQIQYDYIAVTGETTPVTSVTPPTLPPNAKFKGSVKSLDGQIGPYCSGPSMTGQCSPFRQLGPYEGFSVKIDEIISAPELFPGVGQSIQVGAERSETVKQLSVGDRVEVSGWFGTVFVGDVGFPLIVVLDAAGHYITKAGETTPSSPELTLSNPEINCRTVTTTGAATAKVPGATIARIHWNWGDGTPEEDRWFPASHTYVSDGTYTITATAYDTSGLSTSKAVTLTISCEEEKIQITNKGTERDYPSEGTAGQPYSFTVKWSQNFETTLERPTTIYLFDVDTGQDTKSHEEGYGNGSHSYSVNVIAPADGRDTWNLRVRLRAAPSGPELIDVYGWIVTLAHPKVGNLALETIDVVQAVYGARSIVNKPTAIHAKITTSFTMNIPVEVVIGFSDETVKGKLTVTPTKVDYWFPKDLDISNVRRYFWFKSVGTFQVAVSLQLADSDLTEQTTDDNGRISNVEVVSTKNLKILFIPMGTTGSPDYEPPSTENVVKTFQDATEYLLGSYPLDQAGVIFILIPAPLPLSGKLDNWGAVEKAHLDLEIVRRGNGCDIAVGIVKKGVFDLSGEETLGHAGALTDTVIVVENIPVAVAHEIGHLYLKTLVGAYHNGEPTDGYWPEKWQPFSNAENMMSASINEWIDHWISAGDYDTILQKLLVAEKTPPTGSYSGRIGPDETIQFLAGVEPELQTLTIKLSWPGSELGLVAVDPAGSYHNATGGSATEKTLIVNNPLPGNWRLLIVGSDVRSDGEDFSLNIQAIPVPEFSLMPAALMWVVALVMIMIMTRRRKFPF